MAKPRRKAKPADSHIAVVGAGSWGTALALMAARNGWTVSLCARDAAAAETMQRERCNARYLPGHRFPDSLRVVCGLPALARGARNFLFALPSHGFAEAAAAVAAARGEVDGEGGGEAILAWGTKGFEPQSGRLLSEVAAEAAPRLRHAAVSGPSFAAECAAGKPTALSVAAAAAATAEAVAGWLRSGHLRVYTGDDITGVQLGGAIKNIMAIAAGISDGLDLGANARAALLTRGLAELARLGAALGGRESTLRGLAGVGDLILTCTDDQSRNRRVGIGLGRGFALENVLREIGQEAEGVTAARALYPRIKNLGVDMPITEQVYRVLFENAAPQDAVRALLQRRATSEGG